MHWHAHELAHVRLYMYARTSLLEHLAFEEEAAACHAVDGGACHHLHGVLTKLLNHSMPPAVIPLPILTAGPMKISWMHGPRCAVPCCSCWRRSCCHVRAGACVLLRYQHTAQRDDRHVRLTGVTLACSEIRSAAALMSSRLAAYACCCSWCCCFAPSSAMMAPAASARRSIYTAVDCAVPVVHGFAPAGCAVSCVVIQELVTVTQLHDLQACALKLPVVGLRDNRITTCRLHSDSRLQISSRSCECNPARPLKP